MEWFEYPLVQKLIVGIMAVCLVTSWVIILRQRSRRRAAQRQDLK